MSEIRKASQSAKSFFKDLGKESTVIGVEKTEEGWKVVAEVLDDPAGGFDHILGLYEVRLGTDLEVTGYERKSMRRRSELEWRKSSP